MPFGFLTHFAHPPSLASGNHQSVLCICELSFLFLIPYKNEFIWYLSFSDISLSIIPSRSIHTVTNGDISFFLKWLSKIHIHIYHIFLIHSPVKGHLCCFHILAIVSDASNNFYNKVQKTLTTGKNDKLYLKIKTLASSFQKILLRKVEKQVID